jgi:nitrogenase molybdenum-iron protein alpha/beta subunit
MEAYHQMEQELLAKYHGKTAVFCEGKLVAIGDDIDEAIEKAKMKTGANRFFVRKLFSPEEQTNAILGVVR